MNFEIVDAELICNLTLVLGGNSTDNLLHILIEMVTKSNEKSDKNRGEDKAGMNENLKP